MPRRSTIGRLVMSEASTISADRGACRLAVLVDRDVEPGHEVEVVRRAPGALEAAADVLPGVGELRFVGEPADDRRCRRSRRRARAPWVRAVGDVDRDLADRLEVQLGGAQRVVGALVARGLAAQQDAARSRSPPRSRPTGLLRSTPYASSPPPAPNAKFARPPESSSIVAIAAAVCAGMPCVRVRDAGAEPDRARSRWRSSRGSRRRCAAGARPAPRCRRTRAARTRLARSATWGIGYSTRWATPHLKGRWDPLVTRATVHQKSCGL